MKKFKKLIALTCVAAMLVPTVAFADVQETPETVEGGGSSIVENDNSQAFKYTSVVVPTVNANTYDFTIDRTGLLDQFDSENNYEDGATVLFHAEENAAKIEVVDLPDSTSEGDALYEVTALGIAEIGKGVDIDGAAEDMTTAISSSKLYAELNGNAIADVASDLANKFFVWVPATETKQVEGVNVTTYTGKGEWVALTFKATGTEEQDGYVPANYDTYLDIEVDENNKVTAIALQDDALSGDDVWDGNIYTLSYTDIANGAEAVAKYGIEGDASGITAIAKDGLYIAVTKSDDIEYVKLTTENDATYVTYTAATEWYNDTSDKATVENKSTTPIAVTVDVTVTAPGLTFNQIGKYHTDAVEASEGTEGKEAWDDVSASVYFTVNAGTGKAVVGEDGKATAYYVLPGATYTGDTGSITFQGKDKDAETGSHNYYKYEVPNVTYSKQSFNISATANANDKSDTAWAEYLKNVEGGTFAKPTISVVYNWVEVSVEDAAEFIYEDAEGNTYDATSATNGWATYKTGHVHTYTDLADTTCDGEGCTTGNRPGFTPNTTFTVSTKDSDKLYFVPTPLGAIESAKVYAASDYANNGSSATLVVDIAEICEVTTSSVVTYTSKLEEKITTSGEYAIVIVVEDVTYLISYVAE